MLREDPPRGDDERAASSKWNIRIKVLEEPGFDVNSLPREIVP
jgi:hypothetical protein